MTVFLVVSPGKRPGCFDAKVGDLNLLQGSRTPFCNGARALLSQGLAEPTDFLVMRHAGSEVDALKATVGAAAGLTVVDDIRGRPGFFRWKPFFRHALGSPVRQNDGDAPW